MKMKKIRTLAALLAAVLLALCAVLPAFAEDKAALVVMGDSITTGYGLAGYTPGGSTYGCENYSNLLADNLGLTRGTGLKNYAVNGDKSADLLNILKNNANAAKDLATAQYVVISIGGNDLLGCVRDVAAVVGGKPVSTLPDALTVFLATPAEQLSALSSNQEVTGLLASALVTFSMNMSQIVAALKAVCAPGCRVIFLAQYNPAKGVTQLPALVGFNEFAEPIIAQLNSIMKTVVVNAGYEVADIPSVIDDDAPGKTNILNMDIHPNAKGHAEIYQYLAGMLGLSPDITTPVVTETAAPGADTTPAVPDTTTPVTTAAPVTEQVTEPAVITTAPDDKQETAPATEAVPAPTEPAPVETAAPAETAAPVETAAPAESAAPAAKKGCGSAAALAALPLLCAGAALTIRKKK